METSLSIRLKSELVNLKMARNTALAWGSDHVKVCGTKEDKGYTFEEADREIERLTGLVDSPTTYGGSNIPPQNLALAKVA